jgi:hypothetical protein
MMKIKLLGIIFLMVSTGLCAQTPFNFAGISISVPESYQTVSEFEAKSPEFSVQWVAVPKILYENNVHKQMVKQIETDLHARFISGVNFKTQGVDFVGKLYQLKSKEGIRYRIISSGEINGQGLILNLGFAKLPRQNKDLDAFMLHFITFEK